MGSATTTRASTNSTTAVKPSAAAARAAAMSKAAPKPRSKLSTTSTTNLKKLDSKEGSPTPSNPEEKNKEKFNGHSEDKGALTNEVSETGDNSNKDEADVSSHTNGSTQAINGIEETNQSEC